MSDGLDILAKWFTQRGWKPFPFQKEVCSTYLEGKSGMLNAPTGAGKTYALWLPIVIDWMLKHKDYKTKTNNGLQIIWITPLRALSKDICNAMISACEDLELPWRIEIRTGDTSTSQRQKQRKNMPECLITTPESLHLLMALKDNSKLFKNLQCVVVDEWHELLGSKRGTQVELGLGHLRYLNPKLRTWGVSATIGNMQQALDVLMGSREKANKAVMVRSAIKKKMEVVSVLPDTMERFPWGGHLGIVLLDKVIPIIMNSTTTLIFTNTRSQCEIWYQKILDREPELAGQMAMHHGSIDRNLREWVEDSLHTGILKAVVCTSSLDLGVDFRPVETVIQIGSPRGVARFLQRAGRSGHRPDATSKIYFLPTNALELLESSALREAAQTGYVENRDPVIQPFDVLIQYLTTLAVGEGLDTNAAFRELKQTYAYQELSLDEWQTVLDFLVHGGVSLEAYDEYKKLELVDGLLKVTGRRQMQRHRMGIGTIVGDTVMYVRYTSGGRLGTVEEYFISRLNIGDVFVFAGKLVELVRVKEMTAYVRVPKKKKKGNVPAWGGGRMNLSSMLSDILRKRIHQAADGSFEDEEIKALKPLLDTQKQVSAIPKDDELLIEYIEHKNGYSMLVYTYEGRFIHEVLAQLIGYRIGLIEPLTFSIGFSDYGFELLSDQPIPVEEALKRKVFSDENLVGDIEQSINSAEMARRKFRDIAVIAGLVFQGYPGDQKKTKHIQSSTGLLFNVFMEYEPNNLLIRQAYNEVFNDQFEEVRLRMVLKRIESQKVILKKLDKPSPFAFPIMADGIRDRMTSENVEDRIRRMSLELGKSS